MKDFNTAFFTGDQADLFLPLTGKYREWAVSCIRHLHWRLNGPEADYNYHLNRKDLIEIFAGAIRDAPELDGEEVGQRFETDRQKATWMFNRLRDCGWIEQYQDSGRMTIAFRMSGVGRRFAAALAANSQDIITKTENTRSTLTHLQNQLTQIDRLTGESPPERGLIAPDVEDLMIAAKYSANVVNDFNDAISEIANHRRELIQALNKEMEEAKAAGANFIEFMTERFMPDISARFNHDSIELYRNEILERVNDLRELPARVKLGIEQQLRVRHGYIRKEQGCDSILNWALERIERHVDAACEVKLPELRHELNSFISRAKHHFDYLGRIHFQTGHSDSIFNIVQGFRALEAQRVDTILYTSAMGEQLCIGLIDPAKVKPEFRLRKPKEQTLLLEQGEISEADLRDALLRKAIHKLFYFETNAIKAFVHQQLASSRRIKLNQLQIVDTKSLVYTLNAMSLANVTVTDPQGKPLFKATHLSEQVETEFYTGPNIELEYVGP